MEANSYSTYEDAVRDYIVKLNALAELPCGIIPVSSPGADEKNAERFVRLAEEIAEISAGMIPAARKYPGDAKPLVREGICSHFIDQATAELLLEAGLLQIIQEERTGIPPAAAIQANLSAALREAINAAEKSSARPVARGLAIGDPYRITEGASVMEAASAFKAAFGCTAGGVFRRVQELGSDVAIDFISGAEGTFVTGEDSSGGFLRSMEKQDGSLASRAVFAAGKTLLNVYEKIAALAGGILEFDAREKIREWMGKISQTGKIELFGALVESLYGLDSLTKSMERSFEARTAPELINSASDLVRIYSDKFILLTGRMRKLVDAIRLGKPLQRPAMLPIFLSLRVELLAVLVHSGYDYILRCENSRRQLGD